MELKLVRKYLGETYTVGDFFIDEQPFCNTIEDKVRDLNKDGDLNDPGETKVYAETAIPYGRYEVVYKFSPKFGRKLPRLLNVPSFEGILIHNGSSALSSSGCVILGENRVKGKVLDSTKYMLKLCELMQQADIKKEKTFITIV